VGGFKELVKIVNRLAHSLPFSRGGRSRDEDTNSMLSVGVHRMQLDAAGEFTGGLS
jgi:hypothetical protein